MGRYRITLQGQEPQVIEAENPQAALERAMVAAGRGPAVQVTGARPKGPGPHPMGYQPMDPEQARAEGTERAMNRLRAQPVTGAAGPLFNALASGVGLEPGPAAATAVDTLGLDTPAGVALTIAGIPLGAVGAGASAAARGALTGIRIPWMMSPTRRLLLEAGKAALPPAAGALTAGTGGAIVGGAMGGDPVTSGIQGALEGLPMIRLAQAPTGTARALKGGYEAATAPIPRGPAAGKAIPKGSLSSTENRLLDLRTGLKSQAGESGRLKDAADAVLADVRASGGTLDDAVKRSKEILKSAHAETKTELELGLKQLETETHGLKAQLGTFQKESRALAKESQAALETRLTRKAEEGFRTVVSDTFETPVPDFDTLQSVLVRKEGFALAHAGYKAKLAEIEAIAPEIRWPVQVGNEIRMVPRPTAEVMEELSKLGAQRYNTRGERLKTIKEQYDQMRSTIRENLPEAALELFDVNQAQYAKKMGLRGLAEAAPDIIRQNKLDVEVARRALLDPRVLRRLEDRIGPEDVTALQKIFDSGTGAGPALVP